MSMLFQSFVLPFATINLREMLQLSLVASVILFDDIFVLTRWARVSLVTTRGNVSKSLHMTTPTGQLVTKTDITSHRSRFVLFLLIMEVIEFYLLVKPPCYLNLFNFGYK